VYRVVATSAHEGTHIISATHSLQRHTTEKVVGQHGRAEHASAPASTENLVEVAGNEVNFCADEQQTVVPRVAKRNGIQPVLDLKIHLN
jgi:hypothetical protein